MKEIEQLREFKTKSNVSFEWLAAEIGVSTPVIFLWFKGRFNPNAQSREKINLFLSKH